MLRSRHLLFLALGAALSACGDNPPFEATYTSPNDVSISYLGKNYHLNRFRPTEAPFSYAFEGDGDLNVVINGKQYDVESPYDVDSSKKKKKKKAKKSKK